MFEQIEKIINDFIKENDFAEVTAVIGADFCYYDSLNRIQFSLVVPKESMKAFTQFAINNGLKVDCGDFILALFHELGHSETIDLLDEEETAYCLGKKRILGNNRSDYQEYMRLADEFAATAWAINYINNNAEKVKMLAEKVEKEMKKILDK